MYDAALMYRLSGILWTIDPKRIADYADVNQSAYDQVANDLLEALKRWIANKETNIDAPMIHRWFHNNDMNISKRDAVSLWAFLASEK